MCASFDVPIITNQLKLKAIEIMGRRKSLKQGQSSPIVIQSEAMPRNVLDL